MLLNTFFFLFLLVSNLFACEQGSDLSEYEFSLTSSRSGLAFHKSEKMVMPFVIDSTDKSFLRAISIGDEDNTCLEVQFEESLKLCKNGNTIEDWTFYRGVDDSWNLVGIKASILPATTFKLWSSVCGETIVDRTLIEKSYVNSGEFGLKLSESTVVRSQIVIDRKYNNQISLIDRSLIPDTKYVGSLNAVLGLFRLDGRFPFPGELRCRGTDCTYLSDPCPTGKILRRDIYSGNTTNPFGPLGDQLFGFYIFAGNYRCDDEVERLSYMLGPIDIESLPSLPSGWTTPSISLEGCMNDGKISKSIFRLGIPSSDVENSSASLLLMCADTNNSEILKETDRTIFTYSSSLNPVDTGFVAHIGNTACTRYKAFMTNNMSPGSRYISTIEIPFHNCMSCPPGTLQKDTNGPCSCPSGWVLGANGCEPEIKCRSVTDYNTGKCECPEGNPYIGGSVTAMVPYTCTKPTKTPPLTAYIENLPTSSGLTFSISQEECVTDGVTPRIPLKLHLKNPVGVGPPAAYVSLTCTGKSYRSGVPTDSVLGSVANGDEKSWTAYFTPDGNCYEYTAHVFGPEFVYARESIDFQYSSCVFKK